MIDTNKAKSRLLSLAFRGLLFDNPIKIKQNNALDEIHQSTKKFASVTEGEQLIEVPPHWNWSRLGYITKNHGQTVPKEDFCYIDVGTLDNIHHRLAEKENLVSAKNAPSRARKIVQTGDVIYSTVRPYLHNICVVDREFSKTPIASTAFCVMETNKSVLLNKFLFYWLLTPEFDKYSNGDSSKGALYPAIGEKDLLLGAIPIPPIEEQNRIVQKIQQANTILDTIDELQAQYADNLTALKSKLIDAAIQGKLTEQLPEDGTAEELYQQIQEAKKKKVLSGKVKRVKKLPVITSKDALFVTPDNWRWCMLESLFNFIDYRGSTPQKINNGVPFVTAKNVRQGYTDYSIKEYISEEDYNKRQSRGISHKGDLLFTTEAPMGYAAIADLEKFSAGQRLITLQQYTDELLIDNKYYMYAFSTRFFQRQLEEKCSGTTVKGIKADRLKMFLVPLPPLAEQKRIVQKLDEILPLCEIQK